MVEEARRVDGLSKKRKGKVRESISRRRKRSKTHGTRVRGQDGKTRGLWGGSDTQMSWRRGGGGVRQLDDADDEERHR